MVAEFSSRLMRHTRYEHWDLSVTHARPRYAVAPAAAHDAIHFVLCFSFPACDPRRYVDDQRVFDHVCVDGSE